MITVLVIYILFSICFLTFVNMQVRVRNFRYELFKIRDDLRFAFIAELSKLEPNEREALKRQFIDLQNFINSMLIHPSITQAVFLEKMVNLSKKEIDNASLEEFNRLPLHFKRQIIYLILSILDHMGLEKRSKFLGFVFRLSIFLVLEISVLKLERFLNNKKENNIFQSEKPLNLPSKTEILKRRAAIQKYNPEDWAAILVGYSNEIQFAT
jgi:hypothetical protein